jgi:hypothetical protein
MSADDEPDALNALLRAERAGDESAADRALDRVLQLAASAAGPEPLVRARVERALDEALGVGAMGAGTGASWLRSGWARAGSKLGLVTMGVAIGFVWGRSPEWRAARAPEPTTIVARASVASAEPSGASELAATSAAPWPVVQPPVAPAPVDAPAPPLEQREATSRATAPARPRVGGTPPRAVPARATHSLASATSSDDSLRIVLEQLRKAQLFLSASEPARALAALDELDARVPAAVLAEERDVTRVLALCKAGDAAQAARLAARVLVRAPDSAYALSLRESCAGQELLVEQMRARTSNQTQ